MDFGTDDEVDRLSSLPDSVLVHILSFLPTLDAVRTMLIKRFGTLWTSLPILELEDNLFDIWHNDAPLKAEGSDNDEDDDGCSTLNLAFFIFVRNVLKRHNNPKINKFRVNISDMFYSDIEERNLGPELGSWIDFALQKLVKILEFNVGMVEPCELLYKLPYTEFVSDSLVELKLEFLEMKLQERVEMRKLRVLRLIRVEISNQVFREIIRGCPLLKELEVFNCSDMNELRFDAPNVEKLIVDTTEYFTDVLEIDCPNLRCFQFTGFVDCVKIIDLQSLALVTFDLGCRDMEFQAFTEFMDVLKPLLSAKIVKWSCEFVTVLFYCMLKHDLCITMASNHVELSMWLTDKHIPGLCRLLRNSPHVEELVIMITSRHSDFLEPIEAVLDSSSMDAEDYCWNSLKSITICNISMCLYPVLLQLVKTLLKHAVVLDELVIYYKVKETSSDECVLPLKQWGEFSEMLPGYFKASPSVKYLLL